MSENNETFPLIEPYRLGRGLPPLVALVSDDSP